MSQPNFAFKMAYFERPLPNGAVKAVVFAAKERFKDKPSIFNIELSADFKDEWVPDFLRDQLDQAQDDGTLPGGINTHLITTGFEWCEPETLRKALESA